MATTPTGGPRVKLNTGHEMPLLGLGTWQAPPGEVGAAVRVALEAGYRHIDCAACYGNEKEIGEVFGAMVGDGAGQIPRSELFVTSKLWNSEHAPALVRPALEQTLADLRLAYVDLYLIHWPQAFEKVEGTTRGFPRNEDGSMRYDLASSSADTWGAMEACAEAGLARSIGLSNFNSLQIAALKAAGATKIAPAVNQVEVHPYFQQPKMAAFCAAQGIVVTAYSPLGSGGVGSAGTMVAANEALAAIGAKHGRSAAQVAIAWCVARGIVCIPKSVTESRLKANIDVFFELSEEEMGAIAALDMNERMPTGWGGPKVERDGEMQPRDLIHPLYPFQPDVEF